MSDKRHANERPATRAVTAGRRSEWTGPVVNPPVWRASTHLYENVAALKKERAHNEDGRFFYGRRGAPTQWSLADALTEMEPGAAGTMLFPSGVAAIHAALLSVLSPGDVLWMTDNAYDPSRAFADGFLKRWGVETRFFDPMAGAAIADQFCDRSRAILLESPGSLTFEVQDVPAIAAAARTRGMVTLLDNTWATPHFFTAIEKGVDISLVAITKYIGGHSDLMMGCATANAEHWPALRKTAQALGQVVSPDDAALAARGLRTLDVRLKRHEESALSVAQWLAGHGRVRRVLHPALPGCPGHELWRRDFTGSTGLFSFELEGSEAQAAQLIDGLRLYGIGYSWGGFESLALPVHPAHHRTATDWQADGPLIRLHIGLEDADDLIADLADGFEKLDKGS